MITILPYRNEGEKMKICCYDCGKTDVKLFERPRTVKSERKNTVDVCRKC